MDTKMETGLGGVTYIKTVLNKDLPCTQIKVPFYEEIFKPSDMEHPFFQYHDKPFNKSRYKYGSVLPLHIGKFDLCIPENVTNVLRCPIKLAGDPTIYLPNELSFLEQFVYFCGVYETSFNRAQFNDLFMHITVEKKGGKGG